MPNMSCLRQQDLLIEWHSVKPPVSEDDRVTWCFDVLSDESCLKSPSRIGKSAAFRRTKVRRERRLRIRVITGAASGLFFPAVRALPIAQAAET